MPKPFAVHELLARVRALLRRARREIRSAPETLVLGGVRFDFRALTAGGPAGGAGLTTHDVLVLKDESRQYKIVEALHVMRDVAGGGDAHKLVGRVKTREQLARCPVSV